MNTLLTDLNSIVAFFEAHKAMDTVMLAWLIRDWKAIVSAYPFIVAQGGLWLIIKRFFYNPPPKTQVIAISNSALPEKTSTT